MADGFSLTTFSSNGKLVQIENALAAVQQGVPALGWRAKDGAVIISQKKDLGPLFRNETIQKCCQIDSHIGCTFSGMPADFRIILSKARKEAQAYKMQFGEPIPVKELVRAVADLMQEYTQSGGVRPFGCSLLVTGYTPAEGPRVFQVDPSGVAFAWKATAIGKEMSSAKAFLEKRYEDHYEIEDAIHFAILTIREGFEGQMNADSIEIGVVSNEGSFRTLSKTEIQDYLTEVA